MDENIKHFFGKEVTVETLSREDLIRALITRHQKAMTPLKAELKELNRKRVQLEGQRDSSRKDRDTVNNEVMSLKQIRQVLHGLANERRREFFILMEKLDDMQKIDEEIDEYSSALDRMEWEIQTTRITANDEKVTIKRMKEIYQKLTDANQEAQKKLGIQEEVASISKEIGEKLADAQDRHELLLKRAKESDVFHETYIEVGKTLSEIRINIRRAERRIHIHKECLDYWKDWVGGKHA